MVNKYILLIFIGERREALAMDILLLFAGSFSCAVVRATFPCNLVSDQRQFQVVVGVPSGLELCALAVPSDFQPVDSVLYCALNCQRYAYCENFNYKNSSKTCELFYYRPTCYGWTSGCTHYQVQYGLFNPCVELNRNRLVNSLLYFLNVVLFRRLSSYT